MLDLKEVIKNTFAEAMIEREQELELKFEKKLETEIENLKEYFTKNQEAENKKLMSYIASTRQEKKSFWSKIFNK